MTWNKGKPATNLFLVAIIFWSTSWTRNKGAVPGLFLVLIHSFGLWILTRNKGLVQAGFAPHFALDFLYVLPQKGSQKISGASRRILYRISFVFCQKGPKFFRRSAPEKTRNMYHLLGNNPPPWNGKCKIPGSETKGGVISFRAANTPPPWGGLFGDFPGAFHCIDLTDEPARTELINELAEEHDFDGLLNNVGLVNPAPLEEITLEQFDALLIYGQLNPVREL